jgi:type IV pilus assembly protein PilC
MPNYRYSAINPDGSMIKDTVEAPDETSAVNRLRQNGVTVIDIFMKSGNASAGGFSFTMGWVGTGEIVLFFRMFSALINSNIPISEAITILYDQAEGRKFKSVLGDIRGSIEGGTPLSQAMSAHPRVFDELLTGMVRAAEMGGILDTILERIADFLESRASLKRKVITSMIYPAVVAIASIVVVVFMVTFVIPKFVLLLGGKKLPANTQFLLDVSNFFNSHVMGISITAAGAVALVIILHILPETRLIIDRYKIFIPVIGPVFRYGVVVDFANILASLLKSGITLVDALKAAGDTIANLDVRMRMEEMNDKVQGGEPLSLVLVGERFFPAMVVGMVKVGEHSGLMDQAWDTVAKIFEKLLANKIDRMSAMVEPVLILVLGGLVGYVAWGLVAGMLAMYAAGS